MKKTVLIICIVAVLIAGYRIIGTRNNSENDNISGSWRNVVKEISQVPFWESQEITTENIENSKKNIEYQKEVLILINDFSDKISDLSHQGKTIMKQYIEASPQTTKEAVKLSQDCQKNIQKVIDDISKLEFPGEVTVNGNRYIITNEQTSIKQIKEDYIRGFTLAADAYGYAASYYKNPEEDTLIEMRTTFMQAHEYLVKGIFNLGILKAAYESPTGSN
jgi:hypothetical protein